MEDNLLYFTTFYSTRLPAPHHPAQTYDSARRQDEE